MGLDQEVQPTDDYPHRIGGPIALPYRESASYHALDIGTNFGLWTEADNIQRYYDKYPDSLRAMEQRLGYRVRPSLIWQRKRYGTMELILAIANDGVAEMPGNPGRLCRKPRWQGQGRRESRRRPTAGRLRQASIILPKGNGWTTGRAALELEVKGVRRPVRWACHEQTNADGSLTIRIRRATTLTGKNASELALSLAR